MESKDIKRYERDLIALKKKAYPFATKATLNGLAFEARKDSITIVKKKMILKNQFSIKTIQVNQAKGLNINKQESAMGSTQDYMRVQEDGGTKTGKGRHGVVIPTSAAAKQGNRKPRTRLPRGANRMKKIKLSKTRGKFKSKKQEVFVRIKQAIQGNNKYVFLDTGKSKAIYKVRGKLNKKGRLTGIKMTMMYDMSHKIVRIPRNQWNKPGAMKAMNQLGKIYRKALEFQLKRHKIFIK